MLCVPRLATKSKGWYKGEGQSIIQKPIDKLKKGYVSASRRGSDAMIEVLETGRVDTLADTSPLGKLWKKREKELACSSEGRTEFSRGIDVL